MPSDFHLYLTFPLYRKLLLRIVNTNMLVMTHFRLKRCLYVGWLVELFETSIVAHNNEVRIVPKEYAGFLFSLV